MKKIEFEIKNQLKFLDKIEGDLTFNFYENPKRKIIEIKQNHPKKHKK